MLHIHEHGQAGYEATLASLSRRGDADLERVEPAVRAILKRVQGEGDAAIRALTHEFEGRTQESIVLSEQAYREGAAQAPAEVRALLQEAADRIRRDQKHDPDGNVIENIVFRHLLLTY